MRGRKLRRLRIAVLAMVRGTAAAALSGIALASKQYLLIGVVPLWQYATAHRRSARKFMAGAAAAAAATVLPFALWTPAAFVHDVIAVQVHEPFRADSLSYLSWFARNRWVDPSVGWTVAALLVALALVFRRGGHSPAAFATSLGFTTLLTFAFAKKAFCNYYFFVIGVFCLALAASRDEVD